MDDGAKKVLIKLTQLNRLGLFAFLILAQIALIFFWQRSKAVDAHRVFLIKDGLQYRLFWNVEGQYRTANYLDLAAAVRFAQTSLNVAPKVYSDVAVPLLDPSQIENLWLEGTSVGYVLHWKQPNFDHLNHLTFQRAKEAKFFEAAFRRGAYSTSPFGHAILLTPLD